MTTQTKTPNSKSNPTTRDETMNKLKNRKQENHSPQQNRPTGFNSPSCCLREHSSRVIDTKNNFGEKSIVSPVDNLINRKQEIEKEIEEFERGCRKRIMTPDMTSRCGDISFKNTILYCQQCGKHIDKLKLKSSKNSFAIDVQNKRDAEMFEKLKERLGDLKYNKITTSEYIGEVYDEIDKIQEEFKE